MINISSLVLQHYAGFFSLNLATSSHLRGRARSLNRKICPRKIQGDIRFPWLTLYFIRLKLSWPVITMKWQKVLKNFQR